MRVLALNYMQWLHHLHERHSIEIVKYEEALEKRRVQYESNWFRKLFKLKFDRSTERCYNWWSPSYSALRDIVSAMNEISYELAVSKKLGEDHEKLTVEFDSRNHSKSSFLEYCKKEGLP